MACNHTAGPSQNCTTGQGGAIVLEIPRRRTVRKSSSSCTANSGKSISRPRRRRGTVWKATTGVQSHGSRDHTPTVPTPIDHKKDDHKRETPPPLSAAGGASQEKIPRCPHCGKSAANSVHYDYVRCEHCGTAWPGGVRAREYFTRDMPAFPPAEDDFPEAPPTADDFEDDFPEGEGVNLLFVALHSARRGKAQSFEGSPYNFSTSRFCSLLGGRSLLALHYQELLEFCRYAHNVFGYFLRFRRLRLFGSARDDKRRSLLNAFQPLWICHTSPLAVRLYSSPQLRAGTPGGAISELRAHLQRLGLSVRLPSRAEEAQE